MNESKTLPLGGLFLGASEDGSKVFLAGTGGELYMDVIDSELGHEGVSKKVAIAPAGQTDTYLRSSDDGSHVYFDSTGVLAKNENENKENAEAQKENLYVYDTVTEKAAFIAQAVPGVANGGSEAQVNGCPSGELGEPEEPGCEAAASSCLRRPRRSRPMTQAPLSRCSSTTPRACTWRASRSVKAATGTTATKARPARP